MNIFKILYRKMVKNLWLVFSLLSGMVLCTALTSSLPIYKDAILERMFQKELDQHYEETWQYPGAMSANVYLSFHSKESAVTRVELLEKMDQYWEQEIINNSLFDVLDFVRERRTSLFKVILADSKKMKNTGDQQVELAMRTGIEDHIQLVDGRLPAPDPVNEIYEALVTEKFLTTFDMMLGDTFIGEGHFFNGIKVRPVGLIKESNLNDPYWDGSSLNDYDKSLIVNEQLYEKTISHLENGQLNSAMWLVNIDYTQLTVAKANELLQAKQELDTFYKESILGFTPRDLTANKIMSMYEQKEQRLQLLLWSLNAPLFILVIFYIYMVSGLLVERQLPEMAVFRSRGASRLQMFLIYMSQTVIVAGLAFIVGPFFGAWMSKILGSSDQFLSFVDRGNLNVTINRLSYGYSALATVFVIIVNLIPMILSLRINIIDEKRKKGKNKTSPFWHRYGLDFVLLGIGCYGLYSFNQRLDVLFSLELDGHELAIDPLLFIVPPVFIMGLGLMLLRLYPYVLRMIYRIGQSFWSPVFYSSLMNTGQNHKQYQFLMMFLIITVSTGIFSTSTARTINDNMEEQIWYRNGSELVLSQHWPVTSGGIESEAETIHYIEPPYEYFDQLSGIKSKARVFTKDKASFWIEGRRGEARLIGIQTDQFGKTAWMKDGLLSPNHHFFEYLNLIAPNPYSVLISTTLAKQMDVSPGDTIEVGWESTGRLLLTIYGIVDYFPTFNPNTKIENNSQSDEPPMLIVGHLSTIQNELGLEPYDVWIELDEEQNRDKFIEELEEKGIYLVDFKDTLSEIVNSRNEPFRVALNGVMSFGFILSLFVTFFGFLLFWILSFQQRIRQFGILRALGITFRQLVGMLSLEQLLTSGVGIVIGYLVGNIVSRLYIPMFQTAFNPSQIVPPFEVMIQRNDLLFLSVFIIVMIMIALAILAIYLRKIKVHQALRLGDD